MELMTMHGGTVEARKQQLRAIWDGLKATREALRQAVPNGRDYSTDDYPSVRKRHEAKEAVIAQMIKEIEQEVRSLK